MDPLYHIIIIIILRRYTSVYLRLTYYYKFFFFCRLVLGISSGVLVYYTPYFIGGEYHNWSVYFFLIYEIHRISRLVNNIRYVLSIGYNLFISASSTGVVDCRLPMLEVVLLTNQRPSDWWYVHVTVEYCVEFRNSCIPDCSSGNAQLSDGRTVFDRPSVRVSFQNSEWWSK